MGVTPATPASISSECQRIGVALNVVALQFGHVDVLGSQDEAARSAGKGGAREVAREQAGLGPGLKRVGKPIRRITSVSSMPVYLSSTCVRALCLYTPDQEPHKRTLVP